MIYNILCSIQVWSWLKHFLSHEGTAGADPGFSFKRGGGGGVQYILTRNAHHEREVSNRLRPGKGPGSSRVLDAL